MNPALYQLLETHYKTRRLALIIMGAVCAVLMIVVLGWGVASWVDDPPARCGKPRRRFYTSCVDRHYDQVITRTAVLAGIPGILLIVAGALAFPLRDISQAPLIRLFTARKDDVAWVYPKRTSVRRYGVEVNQIHEVVVCTTDGKRVLLTMNEGDVQACVRLMAAEAPRAATGFGDDLETRFCQNPHAVMETAVPAAAVAQANAPSARLVVAPDVPFARIDQGIRYLGFAAEPAPPAPMPIPGEPAHAAWTGKGVRIAYAFDPSVYLRVLEIFGGDPNQLASELAGVVGVPLLGPQQIVGLLAAPDPRTLLLGLAAAEATGTPQSRDALRDQVMRLQSHPDPAVAQAAQRVHRGWA